TLGSVSCEFWTCYVCPRNINKGIVSFCLLICSQYLSISEVLDFFELFVLLQILLTTLELMSPMSSFPSPRFSKSILFMANTTENNLAELTSFCFFRATLRIANCGKRRKREA